MDTGTMALIFIGLAISFMAGVGVGVAMGIQLPV